MKAWHNPLLVRRNDAAAGSSRTSENGESRLVKPISIDFNMQIDLTKRRVMVAPVLPFLTGCGSAPSRSILGSYFPSWMICVLIGIGLSIVVRWILVKLGMEKELPVPIVVHLAFAIAFSFAAWLLWLA